MNPDTNLNDVIKLCIEAFQGGNLFVAGGIVVMLVVWVASKWVKNPKYLPYLSLGVGMILSVLTTFMAGNKTVLDALVAGLCSSGPACLFWSLVGKNILPRLGEEKKDSQTLPQ